MGKIAVIFLVACAAFAAVGIYWTQTRAFWRADDAAQITLFALAGEVEPMPVADLDAIRSDSSPIGFRACFTTPLSLATLTEGYVPVPDAEPTVPPPWFDCFDAGAIVEGLETGRALAFVGHKNIAFGVDRIVAVFDDGRGFAWHTLNDCGRKAYDGTIVGEACPDRATFQGSF